MKYNLNNYEGLTLFKEAVRKLISNGAIVNLDEDKNDATWTQSKARWLYFGMVADELNERGETYQITEKLECKFTKDLIYSVYWQSLRAVMFPEKKKLNTKEFGELVDMMIMMMAKIYNVSIPFPDKNDVIL